MATAKLRPVKALRLVKTNGAFGRLWASRAVSLTGDVVTTTALVLHVEQATSSAVLVGVLVAVQGGPNLLGPVLGVIADRVERRRFMLFMEISQVAVSLLLAITVSSVTALLILLALSGLLAAAYRPASRSALADLVDHESLATANSLIGSAASVALIAGPLSGAALFGLVGVKAVLILNAATFAFSFAMLVSLPPLPAAVNPDAIREDRRRLFPDLAEALQRVTRTPTLNVVVPSALAAVTCLSIDNVAAVFLVRDALHLGSSKYGLLVTVAGVGMLTGTSSVAILARRVEDHLMFTAAILIGAGGLLTLSLAPSLGVALIGAVLAGLSNGIGVVIDDTLVMKYAPAHMRGRVFGLLSGGEVLGYTVASTAGGPLVDAVGARAAFGVAAAGALGTYAVATIGFRRQIAR